MVETDLRKPLCKECMCLKLFIFSYGKEVDRT